MEKGIQARGELARDRLPLLAGLGLTWLLTVLKLPFGLAPAGLAWAGAWNLAGLPGGRFLLIAAYGFRIGWRLVNFPAGWGSLPLLLVFYRKKPGSTRGKALLFYLLLFVVNFYFIFRRGGQAFVLRELGEVAAVALLAWLLAPGLQRSGEQRRVATWAPIGTDRAGLAFGLMALLLYLTLSQLTLWTNEWWQLELNYCYLFFLLMVAGSGTQSGLAPALGLVFILAEVTLGQVKPGLLFWIGGSSLLPLLIPLKGKGRIVLAVILSGAVGAVFLWGTNNLWSLLAQAILAMLLYLAIPAKKLARWSQIFTGKVNAGEKPKVDEGRFLWAENLNRLREMGILFQEMATAFAADQPKEEETYKEELHDLFQELAEANCLACPKYALCWQERFYHTYQELFTVFSWAELGVEVKSTHLKGSLAKECVKKEALLQTVNLLMEQERTTHYWRRRFTEAKYFLARRLAGVAEVLTKMAATGDGRMEDPLTIQGKLGKTLRKAGVSGAKVSLFPARPEGGARLLVEKKTCAGVQECRLVVAPLLSTALGQQLAVTHWECGRDGKGKCLFALGPEPVYAVDSAVVQLAKPGNEVSGDSQRMRMIGDHLFLCLLSDGMGVGTAAARISQTAVGLMDEMLAVGFKKKFALESLNDLLLLATPEEDFATLDLLLFDRLSGEIELYKVGSAPTYVKKGREVQVIRSTSLPVGIVPKVEPEYYRDFLDDGDLVVMVSDGASNLGTLGDDWLLKALKRAGVSAAEPLSQYLAELAKIEAGGEINDDLTILVLQIKAVTTALD